MYKLTHTLTHLQAMDKMLPHQHLSVSEMKNKNNYQNTAQNSSGNI